MKTTIHGKAFEAHILMAFPSFSAGEWKMGKLIMEVHALGGLSFLPSISTNERDGRENERCLYGVIEMKLHAKSNNDVDFPKFLSKGVSFFRTHCQCLSEWLGRISKLDTFAPLADLPTCLYMTDGKPICTSIDVKFQCSILLLVLFPEREA